jgi:hypothetical protein
VFKKAFQVAITFSLLLAGYVVYTHAFALLVSELVPPAAWHPFNTVIESKTKRLAIDLSRRAFGRDHWSNDEELQIRYYNAERGYWMYAKNYDRKNAGKQLILWPFAMIWQDRNGHGLKTATSDSTTLDLDRPLLTVDKPGAASPRVIHARMEGNVVLGDDKGTPDTADDLRITGLNYIDYVESTLLITGDDADTVDIVDRDMRVTGKGVVIKLRPKDPATLPPGADPGAIGFEGAQTAFLKKDVHIVISDVGAQGILPGPSQLQQRQGGKTPLDLRGDGDGTLTRPAMQLDLPKPRMPVKVGPPAPPGPTYARFLRNVEVLRGKPGTTPDRLNCDDLFLTLVHADKDPASANPAQGQASARPGDGQAQSQTPDEGSGPHLLRRPGGKRPLQPVDPQEAAPRRPRRDLSPRRRQHAAHRRQGRPRARRSQQGQDLVVHENPHHRCHDLRQRQRLERLDDRGPRPRRAGDATGPRPARRAHGASPTPPRRPPWCRRGPWSSGCIPRARSPAPPSCRHRHWPRRRQRRRRRSPRRPTTSRPPRPIRDSRSRSSGCTPSATCT